jgi:hypothetical protein
MAKTASTAVRRFDSWRIASDFCVEVVEAAALDEVVSAAAVFLELEVWCPSIPVAGMVVVVGPGDVAVAELGLPADDVPVGFPSDTVAAEELESEVVVLAAAAEEERREDEDEEEEDVPVAAEDDEEVTVVTILCAKPSRS